MIRDFYAGRKKEFLLIKITGEEKAMAHYHMIKSERQI